MKGTTCLSKRRARYTWLVRGALGLAILAVAIWTREPLVAIPALLAALIAFRGCPMCWVVGLIDRGVNDFAPSSRKDTP